ncbi:hypothetical protein BZM27_51340 [Paraburkholderia steynii]|uniref:Uncharacterized protein n=1 Tax=Paraburkholderia steynii TaxID=1245441 RepID=A0A4R0X8Q9_9BURK|nr:hypothetical protein BZM27_51340 [Paraburkholderia steynii]
MIEQILAYCGPYQAANIDDLRGHKGEGVECLLLKGERVIGTATEWANDGPITLDIPTEEGSRICEATTNSAPKSS